MTPYNGEEWRYNLPEVSTYSRVLNEKGVLINNQVKSLAKGETLSVDCNSISEKENYVVKSVPEDIVVRIPMPRRSLLVIYGSPRYDWEHRVLRDDVCERRLCLAYREFTPHFLPGGKFLSDSAPILQAGKKFWDYQKKKDLITLCA